MRTRLSHFPARLHCVTAVIASFICSAAFGMTVPSESPALKQLREAFEQHLRIASGSLNDYYARALAGLEASLAAAGDYEQARAVKSRRDELLSIGLTAATAAPPTEVAIPLKAELARTYGAVIAKGTDLVGWRTTSCGAEWTLPKFTPGTYRLRFTYTMGPRPADPTSIRTNADPVEEATYLFKEISSLSSAAKNSLSIALATTGKEAKEYLSDTALELTHTPITFRLGASATYSGNVITISNVSLVAAAAPVSGATATLPMTVGASCQAELKALLASLPAKLASARESTVQAYNAKLDAMGAATPSDDALGDAIDAEKRKAKKALTDVTFKPAKTLENFDEITDARFVPDPANTGDTFKISAAGKELRIRLALIACPPLDPSNTKSMKVIVDRFGLEASEAMSLAHDAQEFTAEYLEGRTLRVLVRHTRKENEIPQAFVLIDDIGLFQGVLIDHGFAVTDPPPSMDKRAGREAEFLHLLRDREDQARKRTPRPGGWDLGTQR